MKSLLVAAGLFVGASAWADTYEILYGNEVKEGDVITGVTAQTDFTDTYATTKDFTDGNNNSSLNLSGSVLATTTAANWTKDFTSPVTSGKVYFSGVYCIASNTDQRIRIVDNSGNVIFGTAQNNTGNNATQVVAYICGKEISNWVRQPRKAGYGINEICIDLDAKTVSYDLTVSSGNGSTSNLKGTVDLTYTNVKGLYFAKASGDGYITYLDNVKFYSVQSSDPAYTINYKLGDNIVRTVKGNAAVDEVVSASMSVNGEGEYAGNHYLITASTAPSMTIVDGTNVLDVPVRAPYTATLNVTISVNGVAGEPVVTSLTETDDKVCSWSFAYSMYEKSGDSFFACDETEYVQTGTFADGEVINKTVTYSTADATVMAFEELGTNGTNAAYSGGALGQTSSNLATCTLNQGAYAAEIYVGSRGGSGSHTRNANIVVDGSTVSSTPSDKFGLQIIPFSIVANETEVYVQGAGTSNTTDNLDYVIIRKINNVSATIGATGYTTFASAYALDLANLPAGLTAYKASEVGADAVTFTSVEEAVPAGTGLLLKGTASTAYNIPVAASASALEGNKLVGCTAETVLEKNANYWVLVNNGGAAEFQSLKTNGATIPAGKAYLNAAAAAGSRLAIVFNDETTGIATVENASVLNENYYNLNGQRIVAPQKGLFIVNGKKVVLK